MSVTLDCTEKCEDVVTCAVCKRKKPPIGRDVAAEMSGSYCEHECPGHDQEPRGGHLWPGELARSREPAHNRAGYGLCFNGKSIVMAHRHGYKLLVGPISDDLVIDHLCRVHDCVNPAHLEPVTNRENSIRGVGFSAINAAVTHCPAGHEYTSANTKIRQRATWTSRACRTCLNAKRPVSKARAKERAARAGGR